MTQGPGSCNLDTDSWIKVKDPGSKIQAPGSQVLYPGGDHQDIGDIVGTSNRVNGKSKLVIEVHILVVYKNMKKWPMKQW